MNRKIFILLLFVVSILACKKEENQQEIPNKKIEFVVNKENFEEYNKYLDLYLMLEFEKNLFNFVLQLPYFEYSLLKDEEVNIEKFFIDKNQYLEDIKEIKNKILEIKAMRTKKAQIKLDKELDKIKEDLDNLEKKILELKISDILKNDENLKKLYEELVEIYNSYFEDELLFKEKIMYIENNRYKNLLNTLKNKGSDIGEKTVNFEELVKIISEVISLENIEIALEDSETRENLEALIALLEYSYFEMTEEFSKYMSIENNKNNIEYKNLNFYIFNKLVIDAKEILNIKFSNKDALFEIIINYKSVASRIIESDSLKDYNLENK